MLEFVYMNTTYLKGITFQRVDNTDISEELLYVTSIRNRINCRKGYIGGELQTPAVTTEHLSLALINYKNFRTMLEEFGCDWQGLHDAFYKYPTETSLVVRKQSLVRS